MSREIIAINQMPTVRVVIDQLPVLTGDVDVSIAGVATLNAAAITGKSAEASISDADYVLIFDASAGILKKMLRSDFIGSAFGQQTLGRRRKSADQTVNNSTTFVNDTHLSVTLVAGRVYTFQAVLFVSTGAVPGIKIDFNGGAATATAFMVDANFSTATVWAAGQSSALNTSLGTAGAILLVRINGYIEVNAGGTFILRMAQQALDASDTKLLKGSWLWVEDMP